MKIYHNARNEQDRPVNQALSRKETRPVLLRPLKGRVILHMPYREPSWVNRAWLKSICGIHTRPEWNRELRQWEISRSHFPRILNGLLHEFGPVDVWEDHSEFQICNVSCQDARGDECICRCGGINHGIGYEDQTNAPRQRWHLIHEDTEVLIAVDGVKRLHYLIPPDSFKPILERQRQGYYQYSYSIRYAVTTGQCPLCWDESILYVDHCHEHGWIRGRICPRCNIKLHRAEEYYRHEGERELYNNDDRLCYDELKWVLKCPDCAETGGTYKYLIGRHRARIDWERQKGLT